MLINCPKCGFSQPNDRYCASCGVDMVNFKPTEPSVGSKILGNPILHVAAIFILVFGAVIFIQQQKKVEIRQRAEFLQGGPVVVQRSDSTTIEDSDLSQNPVVESLPDETVSEDMAAASNAAPPPPMGTLDNNDGAMRAAFSKGFEGTAQDTPAMGKVTTYYIEMDRAALRQLILDSQSAGQFTQFGDSTSGPVPEIDQKLTRLSGSSVHHKVEEPIDPKSSEHTWFVGTQENSSTDPGAVPFGLTTSIAFNEMSANSIRGDIEVRRVFPEGEPKPSIVARSFPANFDLGPRMGLLLAGLIPHKISMEGLAKLRPDNFFKIYNSKSFENSQTEFVMLLKFEPPRAGNSADLTN